MICDTKTEILNQEWDFQPFIFRVSYLGKDIFVSALTEGSAVQQAEKHFRKIDKKRFDESRLLVQQIGRIVLKPVFVETQPYE